MNYDPGHIVLIKFPYSEKPGFKKRPAIVIVDTNDNDLIVARVTTRLYSSVYDVMINHWRDAGLLAPSVIRTHKLATLGKGLVERELGVLGTEDFEKFKKVFNENIIM